MGPKIVNPLLSYSLNYLRSKYKDVKLMNEQYGQSKSSLWILRSISVYKSGNPFFNFQTSEYFVAQGIHKYQDSLCYKLNDLCTCIVNINISKSG